MDQASDSTPDPMTAVMMWELAVHTVPVRRSQPSSSNRSSSPPFPDSTDTSIGATFFIPLDLRVAVGGVRCARGGLWRLAAYNCVSG
jgi:hypothetical protein